MQKYLIKYLCHDVSQLAGGVDVCEVNNILVAPVADDMVFDIDVLGSLRSHVIGCHADGCLIVFTEEDGFL